jgi:hypothetical protein
MSESQGAGGAWTEERRGKAAPQRRPEASGKQSMSESQRLTRERTENTS